MLKITIITVSYNAAATIEQTISSVVHQDYPNIEYIIIDGGSTDGTIDIIKRYESYGIRWISEPDHGIYDAMNKGIRYATGDYLYFLGADDWLCNNEVILSIRTQGFLFIWGMFFCIRMCIDWSSGNEQSFQKTESSEGICVLIKGCLRIGA